MTDIKPGDRVRRTEAHSMGEPAAGYEFVVGTVCGRSVTEVGATTIHNLRRLERVPLATGGAIVTPSGEIRTTSSTGGEKGVKPEDYALIPWGAMDEIARVYAFGAQKYAAHNWRKGYEWGKSFSALCRHIFAFWKGEDRDPESGLSHLAHAGFHVLSLLTFWLERDTYGEHDDRYTPPTA
jgi:hypothetical protein